MFSFWDTTERHSWTTANSDLDKTGPSWVNISPPTILVVLIYGYSFSKTKGAEKEIQEPRRWTCQCRFFQYRMNSSTGKPDMTSLRKSAYFISQYLQLFSLSRRNALSTILFIKFKSEEVCVHRTWSVGWYKDFRSPSFVLEIVPWGKFSLGWIW